jgi:hypothetical protein
MPASGTTRNQGASLDQPRWTALRNCLWQLKVAKAWMQFYSVSAGSTSCHLGYGSLQFLSLRLQTLITDHWLLEKLGKVHTKTLNWLQEIMKTPLTFTSCEKRQQDACWLPVPQPFQCHLKGVRTTIAGSGCRSLIKSIKLFCLTRSCLTMPNFNIS